MSTVVHTTVLFWCHITIEDTMADDAGNSWYVQLNQDGVTLEEGKSYRLSFRAKSSIARKISYAMQEFEGNWTNYSKTGAVDIDKEWKTFTSDFTMDNPTDTACLCHYRKAFSLYYMAFCSILYFVEMVAKLLTTDTTC